MLNFRGGLGMDGTMQRGDVNRQDGNEQSHGSGGEGPLLETLIALANLPEESMTHRVRSELHPLVEQTGGTADCVTLDQLRAALVLYLESIHLDLSAEAKSEIEGRS